MIRKGNIVEDIHGNKVDIRHLVCYVQLGNNLVVELDNKEGNTEIEGDIYEMKAFEKAYWKDVIEVNT